MLDFSFKDTGDMARLAITDFWPVVMHMLVAHGRVPAGMGLFHTALTLTLKVTRAASQNVE